MIATPKIAAAIRMGNHQLGFAGSLLTIRLAATTTATPALPGGGPFVILPSWAVPRLKAGAAPNIELVIGPRLSSGDLTKALRRTLPDSEVVFRQAALAAETGSPLVRSADIAFDLCVVAAVAVSIAAILLGLLLSGRDRTRVAAWLAALGMTRRQARRLAMLDALPLALIAVVGAELAGARARPDHRARAQPVGVHRLRRGGAGAAGRAGAGRPGGRCDHPGIGDHRRAERAHPQAHQDRRATTG